jgi:hypothetical protein
VIWGLLENLKGNGEDDWCDHHADSEDDVLGEVNCGVGDVGPGEFVNIGGTFRDCDEVCCEDAAEPEDES